jgi:hypothetical protein
LISGKAFQRRKPRDGFRRSYAALESICKAKLHASIIIEIQRISLYLLQLNLDRVEVVFEELYRIEVYPKG